MNYARLLGKLNPLISVKLMPPKLPKQADDEAIYRLTFSDKKYLFSLNTFFLKEKILIDGLIANHNYDNVYNIYNRSETHSTIKFKGVTVEEDFNRCVDDLVSIVGVRNPDPYTELEIITHEMGHMPMIFTHCSISYSPSD